MTSSNQGSAYTELVQTVAADANHGWVELKVTLDSEKNYYGIVILPMKASGETSGDGQYFYVDDIVLYNTIAPLG